MATKKRQDNYEAEDQETTLRPEAEWVKRVNVDIPVWAIKELDREAERRGVTRQSLIKMWLVDRLDALQSRDAG